MKFYSYFVLRPALHKGRKLIPIVTSLVPYEYNLSVFHIQITIVEYSVIKLAPKIKYTNSLIQKKVISMILFKDLQISV